jgi:hypothetical protein
LEEKMIVSRRIEYALCVLFLASGLAACSTYKTYMTESLPRQQEIKIDGKTDDWLGSLSIIEDGSALVGFRNDQDNFYVCLKVEEDSLQAQIMRQGLTVWFDPQGKKAKSLGIRYPLGMPRGETPEESRGEPGSPPSWDLPEGPLSTLEILRSEKGEHQKLEIADIPGIEIAAAPSRGLFVYELKIPLLQTESHLVAVGAQPGRTIGIGFETPKPDRGQMPGPPSGGMPGGGGQPPMGGMPGGGGRGRPGGMPGGGPGGRMMGEMPKGLKFWTLVQLSPANIEQPVKLLSASSKPAYRSPGAV